MDEGQIVLIGNEADVLHCGYSHAIADSGKRFPSAEHYAHSMILTQLGLDDSHILELLGCPSNEVKHRAKQLLLENMPPGHDLNSLRQYLETSRQSYTMQGLRIRIEQDSNFEKALMDTKEALLIICDSSDKELGIGMTEQQFMEWMSRERLDAHRISMYLRNEVAKPTNLGANQLGYFLMWLRFEIREKRRAAKLNFESSIINGLSTESDGGTPLKIACNDQIVQLKGIFRPLSNFYAHSFEMKGGRYRSVEHYAYEKLFNALHLGDKIVEKIVTTVDPCDLPKVMGRVLEQNPIDAAVLEDKLTKVDRWRQSAMKHKIRCSEYLQQLLLSTGDALLVDTSPVDSEWVCGATEAELQHLLTKDYVTPSQLVAWMREEEPPARVVHLQGNKAALLLMELRSKYAETTSNRIPLVTFPPTGNIQAMPVSHHMICFTPESVWHPLYPAEIRVVADQPLLPSPAHYVAQETARYFNFNEADTAYVMETRSSVECWRRMYETIESRSRGQDPEQSWYMERRQKMIYDALRLLFEQHLPLLKALLDTGDAVLVYCARWNSVDAELSVGMREHDLRYWLGQLETDTKQFVELCTRPMAFRPPYLGGNRLGFILMELRREFQMKGAMQWAIPDIGLSAETILGTESPSENLLVDAEFDVLDAGNYTALWINPLLMLAKKTKDPILIAMSRHIKTPPKLVSVDDTKINTIMEHLDECKPGRLDLKYLSEIGAEDLRAVFMRLCLRVRQKMVECEKQQNDMSLLSKEIAHMQSLRRGIEESGGERVPPSAADRIPSLMSRELEPPAKSTQSMLGQPRDRERQRSPNVLRTAGGRDRGGYDYERAPTQRRLQRSPEDRGATSGDRRRMGIGERRDYGLPRDDHRDRGRGMPMPQRAGAPPSRQETAPPPQKKETSAPPKPKKERPPDEELSEGEIVDSDDE